MRLSLIYIIFLGIAIQYFPKICYSQLVTNNAGLIHISNGAIVRVNGNMDNLSGSEIENSGILTITGDITNNADIYSPGKIDLYGNWTNNLSFVASGGSVFLKGSDQNIGGINSTTFSRLILSGTGEKNILKDITVTDSLYLNDRNLNIGNNVLYFSNQNPGALTRTTGFITNNLSGRFIRKTSSLSPYLFPMGSTIGISRYRPIEINPSQSSTCKFSVGFINHDANNDALNRNLIENNICQLNDQFYHQINLDSGINVTNISIYYDLLADGNWTTAANWKTVPGPHWEKTDSTIMVTGNPLNRLEIFNWYFFGSGAFILGKPSISVDLGTDIAGCQGDTFLLSTPNLYSNYLWSNSATSPTIEVNAAGSYSITVTENGCSASDTIIVTTSPLPVANAGQDISICYGTIAQLNASGGSNFLWLTSNNLNNPNISNPEATPSISTNYIVEVSNGPCKDWDTVTVQVLPIPLASAGPDTTIFSGVPYQLLAIAPTAVTVIWAPTTGLSSTYILNPQITINESSTYYFTVFDINNCTYTDTINLQVIPNPEISIYNTFTPNSDGINDTWAIDNIIQYPENHLLIYNRNGHVVYEKFGYNNEWDGKYYGSELPAATYYFTLEIKGFETFKGDITIIR